MTIQPRRWGQGSVHVGAEAYSLAELLGRESWMDDGLCAQTDPEAFYPAKGEAVQPAKRICIACPVRVKCLEYALAHDDRWGIWGGMSGRERERMKRGQPARNQTAAAADERALTVQAMAAEGATGRVIAETLGLALSTVQKALKRRVVDGAA